MIYVDIATTKEPLRGFRSGITRTGEIVIARIATHEEVAAKLAGNYNVVCYMRLTPQELHDLEALELFGGDANNFVWSDQMNEVRWQDFLNHMEPEAVREGKAGDVPPTMPEFLKNGTLDPTKIKPLRDPREQLVVKE